VRRLLLKVAAESKHVLRDPAPDVILTDFGDSSINFELRVWTISEVRTPKILKSDLYFAMRREFLENNIEIPFPQRDVHLRSSEAVIKFETNPRQTETPEPQPHGTPSS
jgi:small-conductance mechanosensitive channel